MDWQALSDNVNNVCFETFKEPATINNTPVNIVWLGKQEEPNGFDYDMISASLKVEINQSDIALFEKGDTFIYRGKNYKVFQNPIQNQSTQAWEVELEP